MKQLINLAAGLACATLMLGACSSVNLDVFSFRGTKEQDASRTPAGATAYQCEGGKRLFVRYLENGAAWVILPEREFRLGKEGAGTRYSNGNDSLELRDKEAILWDGANVIYTGCKAAAG